MQSDKLTAAVTALAEAGVPVDVQELLLKNNALGKALEAALSTHNAEPVKTAPAVAVKAPILSTRFKLSFDGKGRCTTFRKDQAEKLEGKWVWLVEAKNDMNDPSQSENSGAAYQIRRIFAQMLDWANENGWTETACQNDRIVDWFGPSDFLQMRETVERLERLEEGHE